MPPGPQAGSQLPPLRVAASGRAERPAPGRGNGRGAAAVRGRLAGNTGRRKAKMLLSEASPPGRAASVPCPLIMSAGPGHHCQGCETIQSCENRHEPCMSKFISIRSGYGFRRRPKQRPCYSGRRGPGLAQLEVCR